MFLKNKNKEIFEIDRKLECIRGMNYMFSSPTPLDSSIEFSSEEIEEASNYLENILNSTSHITPEILFEVSNMYGNLASNKFKSLLEKAFIQGINPNIQDEVGRTLLECFCIISAVDLVQFLLEKDANPNTSDDFGYTPLIITIIQHRKSDVYDREAKVYIAELLLQNGALTELKDSSERTPLQLAVTEDNTEVVKLLMQYGADIDAVIPPNWTSVDKSFLKLITDLEALLILTKVCKDNDFSTLDDLVTAENIKAKHINEFVNWQLSITPENSRFFDKHLSELNNFKDFLAAKPKLVNDEAIQKLNEYIASYDTLKVSLSDNIENLNDIALGLTEKTENRESKLVGEAAEATPETA